MLQKELTEGLWNWYPYGDNTHKVKINKEEDLLKVKKRCADYVLISGLVEKSKDPILLLKQCRELLKPQGHLLIGAENRLGLSKFCGDRDPYTNRMLDGIEGYRNFTESDIRMFGGRCYAKYELEEMLDKAGLTCHKFYSVLPNLDMPQQIYDEDYLPREELAIRYTPLYHSPSTVYLQEEKLYTSVIRNGMFHQLANAYLIDCSMDGGFPGINHVTTSMDRGAENAQATIIFKNGTVEKRALFPQGKKRITALLQNTERLQKRGISVIPMQQNTDGDGVVMPYSTSESALSYLRRLIFEDKEAFVRETERFLTLILSSSEQVDDKDGVSSAWQELGTIYEHVYLDMVPLNAFYENGDFVFYDQEFCQKNYPIGVALVRALDIIYMQDKCMDAIVPEQYFLDKYQLGQKVNILRVMGQKFIDELRNKEELSVFRQDHMADAQTVFKNRERMQYTPEEYKKIFLCFEEGMEEKDLFLFGSGLWARKFVAEFSDRYHIKAMLDNKPENWGKTVDGIEVLSPESLQVQDRSKCKVMICVKYYASIVSQIRQMGIVDFGIYDPNIERDRNVDGYVARDSYKENKDCIKVSPEKDVDVEQTGTGKPYHVGYVAGVFDLFHKGHLNLLRRAKEQCDYLIVGVVSDEQAAKGKERSPYVSEKDRKDIVEACKYVDEAFILPVVSSTTRDVYKKYHFDVQFSGSDYERDPAWLEEQSWLRKRGADLVFFPYTKSVSSTKLKDKMEEL